MSEPILFSPIQSNGYEIHFGSVQNTLKTILKNKFNEVFILTDSNTTSYCFPLLLTEFPELKQAPQCIIPAGEQSKTIETASMIWKFLMDHKASRQSLLLNLGGGVLTDIGAFTAATYKRGISFIQIPTTLLSQVDASVGGKTGIDFNGEKNMVGTFSQPKAVLIDDTFLNTLSDRELCSGAAEIIKHGLISDAAFFENIYENLGQWLQTRQIPLNIIRHSIYLKNNVVLADPEEKNVRKILNFGHTIGHALETYFLLNDEYPLSHGEAIGIGMICEAQLSSIHAGLSIESLNLISNFLFSFYGGRKIAPHLFTHLLELMKNDKKNENGNISFSLLLSIGKAAINFSCTQEEILNSFEFFNKNFVL